MAEATLTAAPTGGAEAPVQPTPAAPAGETTLGPQVERGIAPAEAPAATAEQTPSPPPEAPRPKLAELLKDPYYGRDFAGMAGEREARAKAAGIAEATQAHQQNQLAQYQQWEQQQINAENGLRAAEAAELAGLLAGGDPYLHFTRSQQIQARQAEVNQKWQANQAQRQAVWQAQQQIDQAAAAEAAKYKAGLDAHFRKLPPEVQRELGNKHYEGTLDELLADWQEALVRHEVGHLTAKQEQAVQAEVKKALARMNLNADDFDLGGGVPVASGGTYRYMNDVEAAFRAGTIGAAEVRQAKANGLPYRGRQ